jgi:hypothetical protein
VQQAEAVVAVKTLVLVAQVELDGSLVLLYK